MINFEIDRQRMVENQLAHRNITNKQVLSAFRSVPRELFIREQDRSMSYEDHPLPIGSGQTISQPYITALMTELLMPSADERILEIGAGSGYQAAILGKLARLVVSVERIPELAKQARENLRTADIDNVSIMIGDGTLGWKENSPYDGIIVTAGASVIPENLLEQLKPGGRMVIPVGEHGFHKLKLLLKEENDVIVKDIIDCSFVPLIGKGVEE